MLREDVELQRPHIQSLSSRDGVAAFFLTLGYTVERIEQSPKALGITPDSLERQIRHVERIASQDDELQVYLFEMRSVRVADRQALARNFRNRAGNFLLVLTHDYQTLDFVLLERTLPEGTPAVPGKRQVGVLPRVLTVDRLSPTQVDLRVLRRFTYTELDPEYQYDKLLSAYGVAEWSEPLFNNRALFSDYYLSQRLPEGHEWKEDPAAAYHALRELLLTAHARLLGEEGSSKRGQVVEPILDALGFAWRCGEASGDGAQPDYVLLHPAEDQAAPLAVCLAYPWNRYLDGRDELRDLERPDENPGARVVTLLEQGQTPYAILTNGKLWRLYAARAHSRATNYYEIDLEETLNSPDRELAVRYFWLFFRRQAFEPAEVLAAGEARKLCFLDRLLEESETYAKQLGERLKERVFDQIFPRFAEGFIERIRQCEGKAIEIDQERLDLVYQGTLTFLYRLMFLLYAEARDLLPVREVRGYWQVSLRRMVLEVAAKAGSIEDEAAERLRAAYRTDSTELYDRLWRLFCVVDQGDADCSVPRYNGGLFVTEAAGEGTACFLRDVKVPDRWLALGLDRLARDVDDKTHALAMIDFKSLGVRQLGSIYEGLLEFKLRIASGKMAIVQGKRTEEVIPYRQAKETKVLTTGRGANRRERTYAKGEVYLENTRQERKATGSYYTPDYIVKYIVEHTVGPVLESRFEALRPRLREAERQYLAARKNAAAKAALGSAEDPDKFWNGEQVLRLAYDVLDVKVLDPAMGSGHFLVEAVDFLTDRLLTFLNSFPHNPVRAHLRRTRQAILDAMERQGVSIDPGRLNDVALLKRQVLKRCVYGVDLNPMAVELAKVSLWLDAFTLGAPLSFLDHHLRRGNSLIGTMARQADAELGKMGRAPEQLTFLSGPFKGLLQAAEIMRGIGMLADATVEQTQDSARLFEDFEQAARPYKQLLDVYVLRDFGIQRADEFLRLYGADVMKLDPRHVPKPYDELLEQRAEMYLRYRFFHWDLEFPEVFIDLERADWKADPGFDAVVGNPPYVSAIEFSRTGPVAEKRHWKLRFASAHGAYDLYILFLELAVRLLRMNCRSGLITPNKYLSAPYAEAIRTYLSERHKPVSFLDLSRVRPFEDPAVYPLVTVVEHGSWSKPYMVSVAQQTPQGLDEWQSDHAALTSLPENLWGFLLSDPRGCTLLRRIVGRSSLLENCGEVVASSTASEADAYSAVIRPSQPSGEVGFPIVDTGMIDRYSTDWGLGGDRPFLLSAPEVVGGRRAEQYQRPKLIFAKLALRIEAMCDFGGRFASRNTNFVFAKDYSLGYYAAICNSLLGSWVYQQYFGALKMGGGYMQFQAPQLRLLPIRRVDFVTSVDERTKMTSALVSQYECGTFGQLLATAGGHTAGAAIDIAHDLLDVLSQRMASLNGERQRRRGQLLDGLEQQLRARIRSLSGGTIIHNYLGDYQKGEGELPFEELWDRLLQNRARIPRNLNDPAFRERLRQEYEQSLAVLRPIKKRLQETDWLIDQIVYKLYGLTEEEIAIVEGDRLTRAG